MAARSPDVPQIQLSILDELLGAELTLVPSGPAPVSLTVDQVVALLASFQDLVLATVAYRNGSPSNRGISRSQREQFALVVSDVRISSFHFFLGPKPNLTYGQQLEVAALVTYVAQLGLDFVQLAQLSHGQTIDPRLDIVLSAMTTFLGIVQGIGRIGVIQAGDTTFRAGKEEIGAIQRLHDEYRTSRVQRAEQAPTIETVERPITLTDGRVILPEPLKREILIRFPQFPDQPIRCTYEPSDRHVLGALHDRDPISISGRGLYLWGAPMDAVPLVVEIDDYSDLPRRGESFFKL